MADVAIGEAAEVAPAGRSPSVGVKMVYALGQVAQSGGFDTALPFLFFYYTAVLGVPGGLVGVASAVSLAVDALADPFIGSWSDNVRSRLGRRLPLMLLAIPLMAVTMGLLFSPPHGLGVVGLFGWLTVFQVLVRSVISLFNVPYIALGAEMAEGYAERSSVVAYRTVVLILAGVVVTALAFSVFFVGTGGLQRASAYPGFGWSVAALLVVFPALCCLGVRRYAAALPQPPTSPHSILRRLPGELAEIFRNHSFRSLFGSAVLFFVAVGLNATLQNHAYVFVWRIRTETIQLITYSYLFGILLGVLLAPALARRMEKRTMLLVGLGAVIIAWAGLPGLRALGLFVPTDAAAFGPLAMNSGFAGVGVGFAVISYPSMMADAADEHELLFRARREGLYFSGLGFAAKAATGLGVLAAGIGLELAGFSVEAARRGALAPGAPERLMAAHGPAAAVLGLIATATLLPYAITRGRHDGIAAELRVRRAAQRAGPAV